jgi:hypothetical protein
MIGVGGGALIAICFVAHMTELRPAPWQTVQMNDPHMALRAHITRTRRLALSALENVEAKKDPGNRGL